MSSGLPEAVADAAHTASSEVLLRLASGLEAGEITLDATARMLQTQLGVSTARLGPVRPLLDRAADPELLDQCLHHLRQVGVGIAEIGA